MKRIEYNVFRRDTRNASGKAKYDASDVLNDMGFERLYEPSNRRPIRVVQQAVHLMGVPSDAVVAVQYPGNKAPFYRLLKRRGAKAIALIHDIEALRDNSAVERDGEILGLFDCLITHNEAMSEAVRAMGYGGTVIELGLFDYLASDDSMAPVGQMDEVAFAGNFVKATFVRDLGAVRGLKFKLYGIPEPTEVMDSENVEYCGSFPSEEIAANVGGAWGLVWDGDSVERCSGSLGEYLRYNCPHKASMYVVAGRPLIVWDESAIAPIVQGEGLGLAVRSLEDAQEVIGNVSPAEYQAMRANVLRVRQQLVAGAHLRSAMGRAIESLG